MKVLYIDTETTGLDPDENDIVQLAMLAEIDGKIEGELDLCIRPVKWDNISEKALEVNNISLDELEEREIYIPSIIAAKQVHGFLDGFVDKYDSDDKFFPAGHNVQFDLDFLQAFFKRHGYQYGIGSYINWHILDSRHLASIMKWKGHLQAPNLKLETLCELMGIKLEAHDAMADIKATRDLLHLLIQTAGIEEVKAAEGGVV